MDLYTEVTKLKSVVSSLESQIATVRGIANRRKYSKSNEEEESQDSSTDTEAIIKAFGGDVPIELTEKYKSRE